MNTQNPDRPGRGNTVIRWLGKAADLYPYRISFSIAMVMTAGIIFTAGPVIVPGESQVPSESLEFISIDETRSVAVRRVTRSEISLTRQQTDQALAEVDRATGFSDDPSAIDLAFQPNVVPPKPVTSFSRRYPAEARRDGVEALLNLEILVGENGMVRGARVMGISLSKTLPPERHAEIARAFARDAVIIVKGVRFTPPVVQGRIVPVRFEMPLRFRLEE